MNRFSKAIAAVGFALPLVIAPGITLASGPTQSASVPQQQVLPNTYQVFSNTISPWVTSKKATYVSKLSQSQELTLDFVMKPRQYNILSSLVGSGGKITPEEYRAQFSPTQETQQSIASFAKQSGLSVVSTMPDLLVVRGTVGVIEKALHINMNNYSMRGKEFYSPANNPLLPASIATNLVGIVGLDEVTFTAGPVKAASPSPSVPPSVMATPDAVRTAYGLIPAYGNHITGAGESIAILMTGGFDPSDVKNFSNTFGIPYNSTNITAVQVQGTPAAGTPPAPEIESTLDVEWSHAIAPGAKITEYETGDLSNADLLAGLSAAIQANPTVINMSFGGAEDVSSGSDLESWHTLFLEAVAKGITPVAASGDTGAYTNDGTYSPSVSYPASDPYVLAVGGTSLTLNTDNLRKTEYAWDDSFGNPWDPYVTTGSGGGYSTVFNDPLQKHISIASPNLPNTNSMRAVPDVSMIAESIAFEISGHMNFDYDGTSFAAPMWSGIIALAAQKAGHDFGNIRPDIYQIAQGGKAQQDFYSITVGGNGHYTATSGYNPVTGWGAPNNGWSLVQDLASQSINNGPSVPTIDGVIVGDNALQNYQSIYQGSGKLTIIGSDFGTYNSSNDTITLADQSGNQYNIPIATGDWSNGVITVNTDAMNPYPSTAGTYTLTVNVGSVSSTFPVYVTNFVTATDNGPTTVNSPQSVTLAVYEPNGSLDSSYNTTPTNPGEFQVMAPQSNATIQVSQGVNTLTADPTTQYYPFQFTNGLANLQVTTDTAGSYGYVGLAADPNMLSVWDNTAEFDPSSESTLSVWPDASHASINTGDYMQIDALDANGNVANVADNLTITVSSSSGNASLGVCPTE
jgi:kumamolisin